MEEILTAEQVAKILQVHPFTVLKFIKQGKLKASKLGRVYRIRRRDVDEFLESQVEKPKETPEKQPETSERSSKNRKKRRSTARKDQMTPIREKEIKPPLEVPTKEVPRKKEPPERSDTEDLDHYVLELKGKKDDI